MRSRSTTHTPAEDQNVLFFYAEHLIQVVIDVLSIVQYILFTGLEHVIIVGFVWIEVRIVLDLCLVGGSARETRWEDLAVVLIGGLHEGHVVGCQTYVILRVHLRVIPLMLSLGSIFLLRWAVLLKFILYIWINGL